MQPLNLNPLKIVGAILALIGFILASITQRQDIDDAVERRFEELFAEDEEPNEVPEVDNV